MRAGAYVKGSVILVLWTTPVLGQEVGGGRAEHAGMAEEQTSAPPLAHSLWSQLVCLCGRCDRLTLADCRCPDAAAERENILKLLKERDLSSPAKEKAAFEAVVQAYVSRFGEEVLASHQRSTSSSWPGWLMLLVVPVALVLMVVVVERLRNPKRPRSRWTKAARGRRAHR